MGRKESARRRLLTDTPVAEVVVAALSAVSVLGKLADSALIAPCRMCDRALSLSRIVQPLEKIRNLEKCFESKAHPKSHLLDLDRWADRCSKLPSPLARDSAEETLSGRESEVHLRCRWLHFVCLLLNWFHRNISTRKETKNDNSSYLHRKVSINSIDKSQYVHLQIDSETQPRGIPSASKEFLFSPVSTPPRVQTILCRWKCNENSRDKAKCRLAALSQAELTSPSAGHFRGSASSLLVRDRCSKVYTKSH